MKSTLLLLYTGVVASVTAESIMYGISMTSALVTIDLKSGAMKEVTREHPSELEAQELSAIDSKRSKYYTMGVNKTTGDVDLCIWSLTTGFKEQTIKLPFKSSPLVGVGEALDVDPVDGTIILMGHDPSRDEHHCVYKVDPINFNLTFVADLFGDITVDVLGGSTSYDYDNKVWYGMTAVNTNTSAPKPVPEVLFQAVAIETGKVTNLSKSISMAGLAYDSQTRRMYGTIVMQTDTGLPLPPSSAAVSIRPRKAAAREHATAVTAMVPANAFTRSLAYFETDKRDKLVAIKALSLCGAVGDIHTLDTSKRIHYSLLMGAPKPGTPYVPTDFCATHKEPCAMGSSCCMLQGSTSGGYCFAKSNCSQIPAEGADPLAVPAYIVGVSIDDGSEVSRTAICSLEPSNKTVDAQCPWSIEVDSPDGAQ